MKKRSVLLSVSVAYCASMLPLATNAATIDGWNMSNVVEVPPASVGDPGASVIYDRALPDAAAVSNGQIVYAPPEAIAPGLTVSNSAYTSGGDTFDGCILASSGTTCDGPFQSGKRFKMVVTADGSIDLVFDVTPDTEDNVYQVFHRLINQTGNALGGFMVELGTGIGQSFAASTSGDGLSFSSAVSFGPSGDSSFSQFPFGLFGSLSQPNPNPLQLPGFFDTTSRSGFEVSQSEDAIESGDFYGSYGSLFGNWMSQEDVPDGLLWDYALGAADPLVMAWDNGVEWEVRRGIDDSLDGQIGVITEQDVYALDQSEWQTFAYGDTAGVETFLSGITLFDDAIEDLANLNLTYAINVGSDYSGSSFTLRTTAIAPVPLPAGLPLLLTGIAGFAGLRFRKNRNVART